MFVSLSLENTVSYKSYTWFEIFLFNMHFTRNGSAVLQREKDKKLFWLKTLCKDWSWKGGH